MAAMNKFLTYLLIEKTRRWFLPGIVWAFFATVGLGRLNPACAVQISDVPMDTQVQSVLIDRVGIDIYDPYGSQRQVVVLEP